MKKNKTRIPLGEEKVLLQTDNDYCRFCATRQGKLHTAGCAAEECPDCGRAVIGCSCEPFSSYDGEEIIQGLYSQFKDLESALQATGDDNLSTAGNSSYLQHAVMRYIFEHVPESARSEITKAFHLRFPGLVPLLQDENGRGYYTAEQLAVALDIPLQEVHERIDAMVTSGQSIETASGLKLRKVH